MASLSFPCPFLRVNSRMTKTCAASSTELELIIPPLLNAFSGSPLPSSYGTSSSSWPRLAPADLSGSIAHYSTGQLPRSILHALSQLQGCVCSILSPRKALLLPCLSPNGLSSHTSFNVTSSRKFAPVPRARLDALFGFHDMWPPGGDTQPCPIHI